jgi:Leucine-rich repeat (LRR) protein
LENLDFGGTKLTDADLEHLRSLTGLKSLILSGVAVTDLGLRHIEALEGLQYLDLAGTKVSRRGVERLLSELTAIEELLIGQTPLATDHDSLSMLQRLRPNCQIKATTTRPDINAAFWNLWLNGTLEAVVEGKASIIITDVTAVPTEPFQITAINFNDNQFLNDACAKRFRDIEGLKKLSLNNTGLTDAAVADLKSLTNLEEMDLTGTKITAEGIETIRKALPNCKVVWGE